MTTKRSPLNCLAISLLFLIVCGSTWAGTITGKVLDAQGKPVVNAQVILCGTAGIPLHANDYKTLGAAGSGDEIGKFAFKTTDAAGFFQFDAVPSGTYRLVAQSWPGHPEIRYLVDPSGEAVNGETIKLHGVADSVVVKDEAMASVTIKPLGTGKLRVEAEPGGDGELLLVSTSPPRADPILGFAGWSGPFLNHWIGGNQMPRGKTEIHGLPEGTAHVVLFANDNSPGFAAAKAEIAGDTLQTLNMRFVAGWSDGIHEAPVELKPLMDELRTMDPRSRRNLTAAAMKAAQDGGGMMGYFANLAEHLDDPIQLPSGKTAKLGDVAAAQGYLRMEESEARRKQAATQPRPTP